MVFEPKPSEMAEKKERDKPVAWAKRKLNFPFDLVQRVYVHCPIVPFCPKFFRIHFAGTSFVLFCRCIHVLCVFICDRRNICVPFEYVMNEWMNKKRIEMLHRKDQSKHDFSLRGCSILFPHIEL